MTDPEALCPDCQLKQLGIRVLGTPLGHDNFVARHLQECLRSHQVLFDRIPEVTDVVCMGSPLALRFSSCELHVTRGQTRVG